MRHSLLIFLVSLFSNSGIAQTEITDSIWHQGMYRSYIVHLPPAYSSTVLRPTAVVLHGGSQDAQKILDDHKFDEAADTGNYILICPNGISESWADGRGTTDADMAGIDDVSFLNALIDSLLPEYAIDPNKLFLAGGSNGGFMTQSMACLGPDKFAAFASVISTLSDSLGVICSTTRPTNMLLMTSTEDPWIPYEGGLMGGATAGGSILSTDSTIGFWLDHNNILNDPDSLALPDIITTDNSTVKVFTYPTGVSNTEVIFYKVIGAGHTVPNQLPNWNQIPILGYINRDIDGASEIWKFFLRHCNADLVGTDEIEKESNIEFHPNPTKEQIVVSVDPEYLNSELIIFATTGEQIHSEVLSSSETTIGLSAFKPGIYLLKVGAKTARLIIN